MSFFSFGKKNDKNTNFMKNIHEKKPLNVLKNQFKSLSDDKKAQTRLETYGKEKSTAAHLAACHDDVHVMVFLISEKFDVTNLDKLGRNPLHIAIQQGNPRIIRLLCVVNSNLCHIKDNSGKLPIDYFDIAGDQKLYDFVHGLTSNPAIQSILW